MKITRISTLSGIERTCDLPITEAQWQRYLNGVLIQDVFPHLSAGDREFILTGSTQDEWDAAFPEDEDENEDEDFDDNEPAF